MSAATESVAPAEVVEDRFALVGTTLEGKYSVEKVIAEGGFGLVYKGIQANLGRPVAIKVLKTPPELNAQAAAEFQRKFKEEATVIARHGHPNIVQVIDFGVSPMPSHEVAPWMVLEWLPGKTLEQVMIDKKGPFSPREVMSLMRPVFEALAFVHEAGIAHRDLKPANIMIVESGRVRIPKLMDFGIAKLMDPNEQAGTGATRTRSSQNAFSPQYASPEQLSGTRSGPWTDVHALGLIISEMLTAQPAFQADDMTQLFVQILSERRPSPAKFNVDVGPWEAVIQRALAMKPDDRFKTAMDMLTALEENVPASGANGAEMTGQRPAITASPTTLRQSAVAIPLVAERATSAPEAKKKPWLAIGAVAALVLVGGGVAAAKFTGGSTPNTESGPRGTTNGSSAPQTSTPNGTQQVVQQPTTQQPSTQQAGSGTGAAAQTPTGSAGTPSGTPSGTAANTPTTEPARGSETAPPSTPSNPSRTNTTQPAVAANTPAVDPPRGGRRQQLRQVRQQLRQGQRPNGTRPGPTEVPVE